MEFKIIFNFLSVCTGNFLAAASYTIANPIYPSEALLRGVSVSETGIVLGSAYFTAFLITPFCCQLWSAEKVYALGSIVAGAGNISFGLLDYIHGPVEFFWLSLIFRTISSLGEAVVLNTSYPLSAYQFSSNHRGKVMAVMDSCYGLGTAAGPSLGSLLFYTFRGFFAPFLSIGIFMILLGGIMLSQDFTNQEKESKKDESLAWTELITCPGVAAILAVLVLASPANKWVAASLEPHFIQLYGMASLDVGLAMTGSAVATVLAYPLVGILLDHDISSTFIVFAGNIFTVFGLIGIGPLPGLETLQTFPIAVVSLILIGFGIATISLASFFNIIESYNIAGLPLTDITTSKITSLWLLSNYIGAFLSSLAGGVFYDLIGFSWSCTVLASIIAVSAFGSLISSIFIRRKSESYEKL
ncbi:MFS-type transporter SLC18B1 isoform X2 [Eurytemora carolleeae]|uniref:MFS-type transporter SLC18B1 isoform X2 n=1 Tax=Eurytemora carolleeae TaxID=1294199 RepID=UPI000C76352B|nr:MFS-type transporter SLC18B1 isoform X2 [Eurytemora carolleeae]|eukprot:XP_023326783.1 MFS-type transporter SLC18B1-like isoform X2 [Eurytemora affinis]